MQEYLITIVLQVEYYIQYEPQLALPWCSCGCTPSYHRGRIARTNVSVKILCRCVTQAVTVYNFKVPLTTCGSIARTNVCVKFLCKCARDKTEVVTVYIFKVLNKHTRP